MDVIFDTDSAAGITRFWWQRIRLRILVVVNQMIQAHNR